MNADMSEATKWGYQKSYIHIVIGPSQGFWLTSAIPKIFIF